MEPDYIYNKNPQLEQVPTQLKMDFSRILNKPFFIKSIDWADTAVQFDTLNSVKIPGDLLLNSLAQVPFRSSVLYRAKITLVMQSSGTPMHQGTLLVSSLPVASGASPGATVPIKKSFINTLMAAPHVFMSANESTPVALEVPFYVNGKLDRCDPDDSTVNPYNFGTNYAEVDVMVLNPLIAPTGGSKTVSVSVFAIFNEVEFYVPHIDVPFVTPAFDPEGIMSTLAGKATEAIDGLFSIAKKFAGDALDAGRDGVRSLTGLHNPNKPQISDKNQVQNRQLTNVVDKPVQFEKMDPFYDYDRITRDYIFDTDIDEMSLKYILSKPQYLGTFNISTTDKSGTLCWGRPITPCQQVDKTSYVDDNGETVDTVQYNNLLQTFALLSRYWKGSLKIHIQAVMSNFHFCKLSIARDYSPVKNTATGYPAFNSIQNLLVETMEFSAGGQVQTIDMPFCSPLNQLPVTTSWYFNAIVHGNYYVYLTQPLVYNGSVSPQVSFNVYVSAGDDFQLFGYSVDPKLVYIPLVSSAVPTALEDEPVRADGHGGFVPVKPQPPFDPESETSQVVNDQSDVLVSKDTINTKFDCVDMRPIVSVRDYARRFYKIREITMTPTNLDANEGLVFLDVAECIGLRAADAARPGVFCSTLKVLAQTFAGYSGGARLKIQVRGSANMHAIYIPPGYSYGTLTNGDISWNSTRPGNTSSLTALGKLDYLDMYDTLSEGTSKPIGDSAYCQSVRMEAPNYLFGAAGYLRTNATPVAEQFINDATGILEFEVPNITPYRFLGDNSTTRRVTGNLSDLNKSTATTSLGHIALWVSQPTDGSLATTKTLPVYVDIFSAVDDVFRYGYQVYAPTMMIPGFKTATDGFIQLTSFGNPLGAGKSSVLTQPVDTLYNGSYYTKV